MRRRRHRVEHDSLGRVEVPERALYGAQTQRAIENFPISGRRLPRAFIGALGLTKAAAAAANATLGLLDPAMAAAIEAAAIEVGGGRHDGEFPVDVFQTGSGTSSNMNANEVIARLAARTLGAPVHANDHVNLGQSSNDVVPTCIHVSAALRLRDALLPAIAHLAHTIEARAASLDTAVTTGRTHLMDAVPITLAQELGGWAAQLHSAAARIESVLPRLHRVALGGTAVGTGLNAHPRFAALAIARLATLSDLPLAAAGNYFEAQSCQDTAVELSGQLRTLAVSLMKIANDLRWMGSGPLAGLAEIRLPALQPGSSIMPGKVNPVLPEAVCMVCARVIGNDTAITIAGQSGNFQLNVMLPLVASELNDSIELLAASMRLLADKAIAGLTVDRARIARTLALNPVLATALAPAAGYELSAEIARRAWEEGRPVREVAARMTDLSAEELDRLLDPLALASGRGSG
ncbi:MAG: class II fumarate hydratase [Gammaproteobacteria bacterium]|nr:class II fumarate hydratase [Gammaproteobacteria bacterium]